MAMVGSEQDRTVAVFGAGIAGLTAAHELARLGYRVQLFEANSAVGGFFRSARLPENGNTPSEYSWHGMGPWYHNTFDLMRQIPFDTAGTIFDRALSRPIDFGIFTDEGNSRFYDHGLRSIPKMFRVGMMEFLRGSWLMLKTWASNRRSERHYSTLNAAERWGSVLGRVSCRTWRSCFGPWIGSDWTRVSLHTAGQFFCKQLTSRPPHPHQADEEGPAWLHGSGDGWLLLRGPSSEIWFDRWLTHLTEIGVTLLLNSPLEKLECDGSAIVAAQLESGEKVTADLYVVATDPFAAARIFSRSKGLEHDTGITLFSSLIQDGPHTQVSFRIAFGEEIRFPRRRTAVVVADSEFNLTLFAQEQVWGPEVSLGSEVKSLWTGTSCVATVPGRRHGLPVLACSKEQFIEEVMEQILGCGSLDAMIREANDGRSLRSFTILKIEVWHEWRFGPEGVSSPWPKWVNTTHNQPFLPCQKTSISNLFLCGAHTKTAADVWSIEGAVESGRLAAKAIDSRVEVLPQYKPLWLRSLAGVDDLCYSLGLPHFLDLFLWVIVTAIICGLVAIF